MSGNNQEALEEYKKLLIYDYFELRGIGFNSTENKLYLKSAGHKGIGVFAKRDIKNNEIIEYCPCIKLGWRSNYHHDQKLLSYTFTDESCDCEHCLKHGNLLFMPLGYGNIYNSADKEENANLKYYIIQSSKVIIFIATKDINKDDELLLWKSQEYYDTYCKYRIQGEKDTYVAPAWKKEDLDQAKKFTYKLD